MEFRFSPINEEVFHLKLRPEVTILHHGDSRGGHYTSFVHKIRGTTCSGWLCDDDKVTHMRKLPQNVSRNSCGILYRVETPLRLSAPSAEASQVRTLLNGPPSGSFWIRDGTEFMEIEAKGKTIISTGKRRDAMPYTFYERQLLGHTTKCVSTSSPSAVQETCNEKRSIAVPQTEVIVVSDSETQTTVCDVIEPDIDNVCISELTAEMLQGSTAHADVSQLSRSSSPIMRLASSSRSSSTSSCATAQGTAAERPTPQTSSQREPTEETPTDFTRASARDSRCTSPASEEKIRNVSVGDRLYVTACHKRTGEHSAETGKVTKVNAKSFWMMIESGPYEGHELQVPTRGWSIVSTHKLQ